jgi:hypothetical protein
MLKRGAWQNDDRVGASLAVWDRAGLMFDQSVVRSEKDAVTIHFGPDEPEWGAAALVVAGQMYVYAWEDEAIGCRLARVPIEAALDRSQWRFFDGNGRWSSNWRDARPVLSGAIKDGILSVHWSPFFSKFMALSSRPIDARIAIRLADHPEGPWPAAAIIDVDTLHSGPGWSWTHAGVGHPELARDSGRIEYVTYRRNFGDLREIRLMEIRFAKK